MKFRSPWTKCSLHQKNIVDDARAAAGLKPLVLGERVAPSDTPLPINGSTCENITTTITPTTSGDMTSFRIKNHKDVNCAFFSILLGEDKVSPISQTGNLISIPTSIFNQWTDSDTLDLIFQTLDNNKYYLDDDFSLVSIDKITPKQNFSNIGNVMLQLSRVFRIE